MIAVFWTMIFIVFYTFIGYGILLYLLVKIRGSSISRKVYEEHSLPHLTHLIAAYNEEDFIEEKISNSLALDYPSEKYDLWVVTDGSTDLTPEIVKKYPRVRLFHKDERMGKIHAVNRVMQDVTTPIVVYSDANTTLNPAALKNMVRHYNDSEVGCVAGEKRVRQSGKDSSTASEGFYWKYESFLKKYDYQLYSVVGAAGELFSIRTQLFEEVDKETLIEDFYLSLKIASKGFKTAYEPEAYAEENSSESIREESKRKVRIAAGGFQAMWKLRRLLNIFKYGWLSFQYISHRVLRWAVTPFLLPIILLLNYWLAIDSLFYRFIFIVQTLFYIAAVAGFLLQRIEIKVKALFIPFYFTFMNVSVYRGLIRYLKGSQSVLWERAARKK
ncbi:MAG: glycosyltransferase family 2 protein [Bacteroidota bacterium]